jgi:hypothetical protein
MAAMGATFPPAADGRQDPVTTGSFLVSEFQWLLLGGELEGFDFGFVPIAAGEGKWKRPLVPTIRIVTAAVQFSIFIFGLPGR